jgi:hypothetical protein
MVSGPAIIEQVIDEIQEAEPEIVEGANTQIDFPYKGNLRLSNFIRFHHPDGTVSDIAAPTFNPAHPTPYRRQFLEHWLAKRKDGKRWFFLTRQAEKAKLPIRCFVKPGGVQCTKRMQSLPDLFMHVMAKHAEESKLYGNFMKAIERKMQAEVDPETLEMLGMNETPKEQEAFYCRNEGCPRFFDQESSRNAHEYKCPQKEE